MLQHLKISLGLYLLAGFSIFLLAQCDLIRAQGQPPTAPPNYVEIIVTACPLPEGNMEPGHAAASGAQGLPTGMIPKPETWGGAGEGEEARHRSLPRSARAAFYRKIGCIDVPIPPEIINGYAEFTFARCVGKAGYLAAMQYLAQNQTIEQKAVGAWTCIPHRFAVSGVVGM